MKPRERHTPDTPHGKRKPSLDSRNRVSVTHQTHQFMYTAANANYVRRLCGPMVLCIQVGWATTLHARNTLEFVGSIWCPRVEPARQSYKIYIDKRDLVRPLYLRHVLLRCEPLLRTCWSRSLDQVLGSCTHSPEETMTKPSFVGRSG